jgi:hypothetical protein
MAPLLAATNPVEAAVGSPPYLAEKVSENALVCERDVSYEEFVLSLESR